MYAYVYDLVDFRIKDKTDFTKMFILTYLAKLWIKAYRYS